MPRKPNYRFERSERDRQKARKKEARIAAKQERTTVRKDEDGNDIAAPADESSED